MHEFWRLAGATYLSLLLSSCADRAPLPEHFTLEGKLLYIKEWSGESRLVDPDYGDLTVLDPHTGVQVVLTSDRFPNEHPVWAADPPRIFFESKRGPGFLKSYTLASPSGIYTYDLRSGLIRKFEPVTRYSRLRTPAVSGSGKMLAFSVQEDSPDENILTYNFESGDVSGLPFPLFNPIRMRWSDDDRHLLVNHYRSAHTIGEGRVISAIDMERNERTLLGEQGWDFEGTDMREGKVLFKKYRMDVKGVHYLCLYEAGSGTEEVMHVFEDMGISNPIFAGGETIYLIGTVFVDTETYRQDIYSFHPDTGDLSRITFDGRHKYYLDVYPF